MGKEQRYQNAASQLLRLVGGKENVIDLSWNFRFVFRWYFGVDFFP